MGKRRTNVRQCSQIEENLRYRSRWRSFWNLYMLSSMTRPCAQYIQLPSLHSTSICFSSSLDTHIPWLAQESDPRHMRQSHIRQRNVGWRSWWSSAHGGVQSWGSLLDSLLGGGSWPEELSCERVGCTRKFAGSWDCEERTGMTHGTSLAVYKANPEHPGNLC